MACEAGSDSLSRTDGVISKGSIPVIAAAIASFEHDDFHNNVNKALQAAYNRSRELADELGKALST